MSDDLDQALKDKLTKVCICKGISRKVIKEAIKDGAHTVEAVQKVTGAGSGGCKGNRCTPKIRELIESMTE
ncbi:(2Fe-2S)-binding protein [Cellulosilyticum sp. I15G10I2]|uniref:(2Fe-2S)-binding protein n=1 Tax=Cellulosilyticum sp. I15G10I2 TaxID=1892843 RepID=UPI00085C1102|nr:(2Fe-2S)-binding protein [Cellulosilyticum sp. I15G10I2]